MTKYSLSTSSSPQNSEAIGGYCGLRRRQWWKADGGLRRQAVGTWLVADMMADREN
jgi:hypothetical protein